MGKHERKSIEEAEIIVVKLLNNKNLSKSDLIIGINTGAADRWPKELSIKKTIAKL